MKKICAKCKGSFTCNSAEGNCWCNTVVLSDYTRQFLDKNFDGCLCPTCLQPFAVIDRDADLGAAATDDFWDSL